MVKLVLVEWGLERGGRAADALGGRWQVLGDSAAVEPGGWPTAPASERQPAGPRLRRRRRLPMPARSVVGCGRKADNLAFCVLSGKAQSHRSRRSFEIGRGMLALFDGRCNADRSLTVLWEDASTRRLSAAHPSAAANELGLVSPRWMTEILRGGCRID